MKKIFENPKIEVNFFLTENVITTSGTGTPDYTTRVRNAMNVSADNLTEKSYSSIFGSNN